jgi:hypothetical protein
MSGRSYVGVAAAIVADGLDIFVVGGGVWKQDPCDTML